MKGREIPEIEKFTGKMALIRERHLHAHQNTCAHLLWYALAGVSAQKVTKASPG